MFGKTLSLLWVTFYPFFFLAFLVHLKGCLFTIVTMFYCIRSIAKEESEDNLPFCVGLVPVRECFPHGPYLCLKFSLQNWIEWAWPSLSMLDGIGWPRFPSKVSNEGRVWWLRSILIVAEGFWHYRSVKPYINSLSYLMLKLWWITFPSCAKECAQMCAWNALPVCMCPSRTPSRRLFASRRQE